MEEGESQAPEEMETDAGLQAHYSDISSDDDVSKIIYKNFVLSQNLIYFVTIFVFFSAASFPEEERWG